jgi:hypothetical protein
MISRKKTFAGISVGEIHRILCRGEYLKVEVMSFGNLKTSSRGLVEKPLVLIRQLGENHHMCYNPRDLYWLDLIPRDSTFWSSEEWLSNKHKVPCDEHFEQLM